MTAFREKYGLPGCDFCLATKDDGRLKRPGARDINGCGKPPAADVAGNFPGAYEALGFEVAECPIGFAYGTPGGPSDPMVPVLLDLWQASKAGRSVPLGESSALYDEALSFLGNVVRDLEFRQWEAMDKPKPIGGR